jgi:hypothetical protein
MIHKRDEKVVAYEPILPENVRYGDLGYGSGRFQVSLFISFHR